VLTGGFTISYLRPGAGAVLRAEAKVVHAGSRQATCSCELSAVDADGNATLCAIAQGTVIALRR
jgi:acyl-coenzyme A thioesterase PaaI-like protein